MTYCTRTPPRPEANFFSGGDPAVSRDSNAVEIVDDTCLKLFSLRAFRRGDLCSGLFQAQGLLLFQAALLDGERRRRALPTL